MATASDHANDCLVGQLATRRDRSFLHVLNGMGAVSARTDGSVVRAITSAIKTGIDIVLIAHPITDETGQFVNSSITDALDSGILTQNEINKSLRRIANLKRKLLRFQPRRPQTDGN
jgi:beta-glucosidase-like glycosyl hydrolase